MRLLQKDTLLGRNLGNLGVRRKMMETKYSVNVKTIKKN